MSATTDRLVQCVPIALILIAGSMGIWWMIGRLARRAGSANTAQRLLLWLLIALMAIVAFVGTLCGGGLAIWAVLGS